MEENQSTILPVGAVLNGRYRIERHLASGGFGITYAAIDEFGERVAIKEFFMRGVNQRDEGSTSVSVSNSEKRAENDRMREKFRKEAMRLRGLKNEHIVKVLAFFEENGTSYYVMNYIDGESLSRRMDRLGGLVMTEQEVRSILNDMLEALDEVHRSNPPLYHLDIKPGNIMVDSRGSAYLIDFGSSKQTDAGSGTSSLVTLTPEYAPLELIEGSADKFGPWTDLYSLGATLYRILTAQKPPKTSDISDQGTAAFHFPDSVSQPMRELIQWMMQPTRAKRPQSVAEVRRRLGENVFELEGDDEETRVGGFGHSDHSNLTPINHAKLRAWAKDPKNKYKEFFIRRFGAKTYFPGELLTVNLFEEDEVRPNDSITDFQNLGELVSNYKPSRFSYFAAICTFVVVLLILLPVILGKISSGSDDSITQSQLDSTYIYESIKAGRFTGVARYDWEDGWYYGDWDFGKPNGKGTFVSAGYTYKGEYKNGQKNGEGIETFENDPEGLVKYEGHFQDAKRNGIGTGYWNDRTYQRGQWVNNEITTVTSEGKW